MKTELRRPTSTIFCLALAVALSVAVGGARAADFAACVGDVADRYTAAKTEYQRGLHDLIVQRRPALAPLARVNRDLQILFAEARRARMGYLIAQDPGRIDLSGGLSRFSNFNWTAADKAALAGTSSAYRDIEARLSALQEQNNGHPDWPDLRALFAGELGRSEEHKALLARFQAEQAEVEAAMAQCRR